MEKNKKYFPQFIDFKMRVDLRLWRVNFSLGRRKRKRSGVIPDKTQ